MSAIRRPALLSSIAALCAAALFACGGGRDLEADAGADAGATPCTPGELLGCTCLHDTWGAGICPGSGVVEDTLCDCPIVDASCADAFNEGAMLCGVTRDGARRDLAVYCQGGKWVEVFACPTPQTCTLIEGHNSVSCNDAGKKVPYAAKGGPCGTEGNAVCTFDRSQVLSCTDGSWFITSNCAKSCDRLFQGDPGVECSGGANTCIGCVP